MSKVMYISYKKSEGVMVGLGFSVSVLQPGDNLSALLRRLKKQNISVIYVSEEVYRDYADDIDEYDTQFSPAISILANQPEHSGLATRRLDKLIANAVGVELTEKEE